MKKINIYINDKLYKTVNSNEDDSYDHKTLIEGLTKDKQAGLLNTFDVADRFSIRIEKKNK